MIVIGDHTFEISIELGGFDIMTTYEKFRYSGVFDLDTHLNYTVELFESFLNSIADKIETFIVGNTITIVIPKTLFSGSHYIILTKENVDELTILRNKLDDLNIKMEKLDTAHIYSKNKIEKLEITLTYANQEISALKEAVIDDNKEYLIDFTDISPYYGFTTPQTNTFKTISPEFKEIIFNQYNKYPKKYRHICFKFVKNGENDDIKFNNASDHKIWFQLLCDCGFYATKIYLIGGHGSCPTMNILKAPVFQFMTFKKFSNKQSYMVRDWDYTAWHQYTCNLYYYKMLVSSICYDLN